MPPYDSVPWTDSLSDRQVVSETGDVDCGAEIVPQPQSRTAGTRFRKLLRDSLVEALVLLPLSVRLWILKNCRRPLLWALFRLESSRLTVVRAGPRFCRYPLWVVWQASTEIALGTYEAVVAETLRQQLSPGDLCLDVGAHIGYHAVLIAHLVQKEGMVVAFEPFPDSFEMLRKNTALNGLTNVKIEPMALADRDGILSLTFAADEELGMTPPASAYAVQGRAATVAVPACSLDSYLAKLGRVPNFIQIDVEGAEMSVLRGAESTLRSAHPKLLVEIHGWGTPESNEVFEFLSGFGYRGRVLGQRGERSLPCFMAER
jgi:FkbM family methyltransferase